MLLTPKQKEIAIDETRFRVLCCGRGFGKTTFAIEESVGVAVAKKGRRVVYLATTIQQARDVAWAKLKERVEPITVSTNESRLEVVIKTQDGGTSEIVLRGWEAIETLRGQEFDFIVIDEVAFMRDFENGWEKVLRPTLRMSRGGALFISTPNGFNHFYELYQREGDDPQYKSFHATSYDNPHIDIEEIESAKLSLPEDTFAQEYMADFRRVQGLVYTEFDPDRHIIPRFKESLELIETRACVDFGYTNPAAMYKIGKDKDGNYYIFGEYYETGKTQPELEQQMLSMGVAYWYPDPAEPDRIEQMRRAGMHIMEVSKDVVAGINTVQSLFKQNRLYIHKSCGNLLFELNFYRWREAQNSKINLNEPEEPIKENDHGLDAIRYALHMWETVDKGAIDLQKYYQNIKSSNPRGARS